MPEHATTSRAARFPEWIEDIGSTLPALLTRERAAEALTCSTRTLDRRIRLKQLFAIRDGGKVVVPRHAVLEYLASRGVA